MTQIATEVLPVAYALIDGCPAKLKVTREETIPSKSWTVTASHGGGYEYVIPPYARVALYDTAHQIISTTQLRALPYGMRMRETDSLTLTYLQEISR